MTTLKLLPIGCKVNIGFGEKIEGVITAIQISGEAIKIVYQIAWWNGRSHEEKWLEEFEVENAGDRIPLTIGFRNDR